MGRRRVVIVALVLFVGIVATLLLSRRIAAIDTT
jgi:hypothetical protein